MKVYVRGIEKTSTLYLYGTGDDEVTEKFILKLGTSPNECEIVTDELKEEIGSDVDWNDVKFIMSEYVFNKYATMFERIQDIYDKVNDTAIKHNKTTDEIYDYLIEKGIITEKECRAFIC
ncbi:MAG: hypothetical protein ACLSHR_06840 [Oscillospiraceae bacterium]|jgi:hypothetical protein